MNGTEVKTLRHSAVLFDLDGTLLDTLEDIGHAVNRVLTSKGFPTHRMDAFRSFIGDGTAMLVTRALPEDRRDHETVQICLQTFLKDYGQHWNVKTKPYDGIPDMLDTLTSRGLRMAVLSNKPDAFTKRCVTELLSSWSFDLIIGQRDGVPPKPDPTSALKVADQLDVPPASFLYLGDSAIDMKTATAAGMFPIGVLWGFREAGELRESGARALMKHPRDIVKFLD
jgi:phosphoglycolate phosphatase